MPNKITFNRECGEFERDGKTVMLDNEGCASFVRWMKSAATRNPLLAEELEKFANFKMIGYTDDFSFAGNFKEVA